MAEGNRTKISELPERASLDGTEIVPIIAGTGNNGASYDNYKIPLMDILKISERKIVEEVAGISGKTISGFLNIKDKSAVKNVQESLLKTGDYKTFIITDDDGNFPSPTQSTVYLDDIDGLMDLFHNGNGGALRHLLKTKEAYYEYGGKWCSENISSYVKNPTFNMQTARVGDLITIMRWDFETDGFYSQYIDFGSLSISNSLYQVYKNSQGFADKTDGEFIQYLIKQGNIYSAPSDPEKDSSIVPTALGQSGKIVFYTAQLTPNSQFVYSGHFWTGNIENPGIYSFITQGRPDGITDFFVGYVSPDGTLMISSMTNPSNTFVKNGDAWVRVGVGRNAGGTGEVFNDYSENFAHTDHGHAEGQKCKANGWNSHAEGFSTTAGISGSTGNAHSEGNATQALGNNSHAEGISTVAEGGNSHAEGDSTSATSWNAHSEGYGTIASGNGAHAEGNSEGADRPTEAKGKGAHAEGNGSVAEGYYSHAEGSHTEAKGQNAHAEGSMTESNGVSSHAEGIGTIAGGPAEHAEGTFNMSEFDQIHSIGIGSSPNDRKNAHSILKDGKHYVYGVGGYNGTNVASSQDLASVIQSLVGRIESLESQ